MKADATRTVGYRMALPPGWVRIELDDTAEGTVAKLVDAAAAVASPANRPAVRAFLQKQFTDLVAEGRERGGQDFYLPIEPVDGVPVAMSIMVASGPAPVSSSSTAVSDTLLAFASEHAGSLAVTIDGQLGVRTVTDVEQQRNDAGEITAPAGRRIDYLSATPDKGGRMLIIAANLVRSSVPEGERLVEAMEFLFDAMVRTIRFEQSEVAA